MQRSSLQFWEQNLFNSLPYYLFCTRKILKKMMNSSFSSNHPGAIYPILQIQCKIDSSARSLINSVPPNSGDDLCLFFCIYPSMGERLQSKDCRLYWRIFSYQTLIYISLMVKKLTFNSNFVILICLTVCKISYEFPFPIIYKLLAKQTA